MAPQGVGLSDELVGLIKPPVGQRNFGLSDLKEEHGAPSCSWWFEVGGLMMPPTSNNKPQTTYYFAAV
jgi:hypothetical protein